MFLDNLIKANFLPLNSVIHPATISVSASGISKGTSSSSAIRAIIATPKPTGCKSIKGKCTACQATSSFIEIELAKIAGQIRAIVKGTSYPNSCKIARTPPMMLNRFVEAQPAIKVKIAFIVKMKRMKMRSPSKLKIGSFTLLKGMHIIAVNGNVSISNGTNLKAYLSTKLCSMSSLERSLIKSAKG